MILYSNRTLYYKNDCLEYAANVGIIYLFCNYLFCPKSIGVYSKIIFFYLYIMTNLYNYKNIFKR